MTRSAPSYRRSSRWLLVLSALVLCVGFARPAAASLSLATSLGVGMTFDPVERTDVNVEVLPAYSLGVIKFDLGMLFHMENRVDLLLRPGVRINLPFLYGRVALPLKVTGPFDWGFMFGAGRNLVNLGPLKLFAEINATLYRKSDFKIVPVEARLGVELGF